MLPHFFRFGSDKMFKTFKSSWILHERGLFESIRVEFLRLDRTDRVSFSNFYAMNKRSINSLMQYHRDSNQKKDPQNFDE